jgi:phosphohistidine phosphatase
MRHAKSDWGDSTLADFDRPLNARGLRSASLIAEFMREQKFAPDLILCSPALRTKTTAEIVRQEAGFECEIRFDENIYEASIGDLFTVLQGLENDFTSVLLVGHNPATEVLSGNLTSDFQPFPTATLAKINLKIGDWKILQPLCGELEVLIRPRNLEI